MLYVSYIHAESTEQRSFAAHSTRGGWLLVLMASVPAQHQKYPIAYSLGKDHNSKGNFLYLYYICVLVCVSVRVGHRTTLGSQLSSTMWVLRIRFRWPDLVPGLLPVEPVNNLTSSLSKRIP